MPYKLPIISASFSRGLMETKFSSWWQFSRISITFLRLDKNLDFLTFFYICHRKTIKSKEGKFSTYLHEKLNHLRTYFHKFSRKFQPVIKNYDFLANKEFSRSRKKRSILVNRVWRISMKNLRAISKQKISCETVLSVNV